MRTRSLLTTLFLMMVLGLALSSCGTTRSAGGSALPQSTVPNSGLISVNSSSVTNDVIEGLAGAVEASAVVKAYDLSAVLLPYSVVASSNGSFSLNLGDQTAGFFFYISSTAPGKAESSLYSYLYEVTQ